MSIAIVSDSTCDLPEQVIRELNIQVIPLFINIGDRGYLDGVNITRKDFYTNLPGYSVHPTTGTPGMDAFKDAYRSLAEKGYTEILSIHISEKLSATVNVARKAAQRTHELVPCRHRQFVATQTDPDHAEWTARLRTGTDHTYRRNQTFENAGRTSAH